MRRSAERGTRMADWGMSGGSAESRSTFVIGICCCSVVPTGLIGFTITIPASELAGYSRLSLWGKCPDKCPAVLDFEPRQMFEPATFRQSRPVRDIVRIARRFHAGDAIQSKRSPVGTIERSGESVCEFGWNLLNRSRSRRERFLLLALRKQRSEVRNQKSEVEKRRASAESRPTVGSRRRIVRCAQRVPRRTQRAVRCAQRIICCAQRGVWRAQ